jgi:hypothetical protein
VITPPETDELKFLRGGFGKSEGRLNGLGATGKELDVRYTLRQKITHEGEEAGSGLGRETAEGRTRQLFADAFHIVRVAVTNAADSDAGNEIEIFVSVDIINCTAKRTIDGNL